MPRFFTGHVQGEFACLVGEDAAHISRSLRMRPGEELTLCDGEGFDYRCRILAANPSQVDLEVLEKLTGATEPSIRLTLYQALPKGDKLEFIVQKAVELGVSSIVPVLSEYCVSRPDSKKWASKKERYCRIALEAAKQSGRGIVPQVEDVISYESALSRMKGDGCAILLYEKAAVPLSRQLNITASAVSLLVGSEGGFSPREAAQAEESGVLPALLGPRILRCETAPIAALSAILYATGNL